MYKLTVCTLLLTLSATSYADCNSAITRTAPDNRYELLNNNTEVKDLQTGLIWQRCSLGKTWNGTSCTGTAVDYNWKNALQTAQNMGNGWRVPNIKELESLMEYACDSSINETVFPQTLGQYLSSSPVAEDGRFAWIFNFKHSGMYPWLKNQEVFTNLYVRLVR